MTLFLVILKAVVEVAALALFGQFIVGIFAWGRRNENMIYRLFALVSSPFTRLTRLITPRVVLDQHVPIVTFLILAFVWLFAVFQLASICGSDPLQAGCPQRLESGS